MDRTLADTKPGEKVELVGINGGGRCFINRLTEMGLVPGSRLEVECGGMHGPTIVVVKGVRLALGQGMAHRVLVRKIPAGGKA